MRREALLQFEPSGAHTVTSAFGFALNVELLDFLLSAYVSTEQRALA